MKQRILVSLVTALALSFGAFFAPFAMSFDPSFNLKVNPGCGFVDLSWDSVPGATGYFVYRGEGRGNQDPSPLEDYPVSSTTYHDDVHVYKGKNYCYFVRAVGSDKREFAQSQEVCGVPACSSVDVRPPNECKLILKFKIGSKIFWINDLVQPEMSAAPIIKWKKTFLVIRHVAESVGAKVDWEATTKKVTISKPGLTIEMWVGKNMAKVNGANTPIDTNNPDITPFIDGGRTLLPLRFVGNNLGAKEILWDQNTYIAELHFDDPSCGEAGGGGGEENPGGGGGETVGPPGGGTPGTVNDNANLTPGGPTEGKGTYTPPAGNPVLNEEFNNGLGNDWAPTQGGGGDFKKFAKFASGELVVDVPEGNWWGKTGIHYKKPFFTVTKEPFSMLFEFDPSKTNGFIIALADGERTEDPWNMTNVWISYHESPGSIQSYFAMANLTNDKDTAKSTYDIINKAPAKATVTVAPGKVKVCTSNGYGLEGNYGWLKEGAKVFLYVFSSSIDGGGQPTKMCLKSIKTYKSDGCAKNDYTPPNGYLAFKDELDSYNQTMWAPTQGGGGDFSKFAKFEGGAFNVNVPKNSWWGKTGIKSKYYFLEVTKEMETKPYTIVLTFDPAKTKGFVACITNTSGLEDPWNVQNVWMHYSTHEYGTNSRFNVSNSRNDKDTAYSNSNVPQALPSQVAITIWPGKVKYTTSQGLTFNGNYAWLKPGMKLFFYVFTHPYDEAMPSSLSLKSVQVFKHAGATLSAWTPPANLVRFDENFTGGDRKGMWQAVQGGGGDFKKFAKFENGAFVVNVPPNSWWGKTGIRTEHPFFYVPTSSELSAMPLVVTFDFDTARTTGFRIALTMSPGNEDPWNVAETIWTGFSLDTKNNKGYYQLVDKAGDPKVLKEAKDLPPGAPKTVTIKLTPGHAVVTTSNGQTMEGDFPFIKEGNRIYLDVFTHPFADGMASSLVLKSIKAVR